MSKRIALELSIGHTHGTEKIHYSARQMKALLADSGLRCTILAGEGIEDSSHPFEDTSVIKIHWNETIHGTVEAFCKLLSDFLGQVVDKMHQRWVLLEGHAFSGNSMYPINIYLDLEGFGELCKNPQENHSIQPDDFFNPQLVFRGTHVEPHHSSAFSRTPEIRDMDMADRSSRELLEEILETIRGENVRKYMVELGKLENERNIPFVDIGKALDSVIRFHLTDQEIVYSYGRKDYDYYCNIGDKIILISWKMGNIKDNEYKDNYLSEVERAIKSTGAHEFIITIPDHPDIAEEMNNNRYTDKLVFVPINSLGKYLDNMSKSKKP